MKPDKMVTTSQIKADSSLNFPLSRRVTDISLIKKPDKAVVSDLGLNTFNLHIEAEQASGMRQSGSDV